MKKTFSIFAILLILASCSSLRGKAEQAYLEYRKAWRDNKISESVAYWHPAIIANNKEDIIIKQQYVRDELGDLAKTETIEILGTKTLPTFVFSGAIFNDVIQLDVVIRISKIENMSEKQMELFAGGDSLIIRELVFLCEYDGHMKIIQSQEKQ
jgi:hypothetical protein